MYSCSEVAKLIASDEHLSAPALRRVEIRLHLLVCKNCARYKRQLRAIAEALRNFGSRIPDSETGAAKERILDRLSGG